MKKIKDLLKKIPHPWLIFLLFALVWAVSFGVRTRHFNHEAARLARVIGDAEGKKDSFFQSFLPQDRPNFMPFTIESSMMFSYASDVAHGKKIPASDPRLAYLPDVAPYAQMNLTLEYVLGYSWRLRNLLFSPPPSPKAHELRFQDDPAFARWVSFQVRTWTALTSAFVFLWLVLLKTPLAYAFAGGMIHAFSAAAVARATGQDIVRGEFCIPLIMACFVLAWAHLAKPKAWKVLLLGCVSFLAFASWDLCQLIFNAWALYEIFRFLAGAHFSAKRLSLWTAVSAAAVLNALFVPFNIQYCMIQSPMVCIVMPLTVVLMILAMKKKIFFEKNFLRRAAALLFLALSLWGIWHFAIDTEERRSAYSHFANVMKAKIKFRNEKPANPAELDYDSRMMWTPSMHSADWDIAAAFFASPGSIPPLRLYKGPSILKSFWNYAPVSLTLLSFLILSGMLFTPVRRSLLRDLPRTLFFFLFTVSFIIGFMLIVRYHEFLIIFFCMLLPLAVHKVVHASHEKDLRFYPAKGVALTCLLLIFLAEASASLFARERQGEGDTYIRETAELIEWFRSENMKGKTVVSDFTISPMLLAYCGTNLVMQPQFGLEKIRKPVEEFLMILYHADEKTMAKFCAKYNAGYFVYDRGITGPPDLYSMRYIANAAVIRLDSCAARMQSSPDSLVWFYRIQPPAQFTGVSRKYYVYKVIRPADKITAIRKLIEGERSLMKGNRKAASHLASEAFALDPASPQIRSFYFRTVQKVPFLTLNHGTEALDPR